MLRKIIPNSVFKPIYYKLLLLIVSTSLLSSCAIFVSSAGDKIGTSLSNAILNNNDLEIVKDGAPAYLLLMDSLLNAEPDNAQLLLSASKLTSAYAGAFVTDTHRSQLMADKSFDFSQRALCLHKSKFCQLQTMQFKEFQKLVSGSSSKNLPYLYSLGSAWASWIQAHSDDWNAIAEIPRVQYIMEKVLMLDSSYDKGGPQLYLGTLATILPPALGGKPEVGKNYFIQAIKISEGKNLLIKVMYAESYARLMFDKELHDRLLHEVLNSETDEANLTLINTFAQSRAKLLLAGSDEYF